MIVFILGALFGAILIYARLNKFNTISGLATLENFAVAKALLFAVGLGAVLLSINVGLGAASFHVKPFILGGIALGGIVFGIGMALLGYCPGTLPVSLGEGSLDALTGIIGGLAGGLLYTFLAPSGKAILGPDLGEISLHSAIGTNALFYILTILAGLLFAGIAFWLHRLDKVKDLKWLVAGTGLAILNVIVFSNAVAGRPIGASTTYPYVAGLMAGLTKNDYFAKIQGPGSWEVLFLAGAFIAALIISLIRRQFKFTLMHTNWLRYKGNSPGKRIFWAFAGGFLLIIGARMAGGCTSGHILSGGMQLALSSLIFGIFVFAAFLTTGKLFYRKI
ncbi:MAG: YeeE/YedE thiosulfate transporter family protein [Prolixibacteraceae bacterium]